MIKAHMKINDINDLKAGDIICIPSIHHGEWSRLAIYEVTKRLIKTYVLFDTHWAPGTFYNLQLADLAHKHYRLVK